MRITRFLDTTGRVCHGIDRGEGIAELLKGELLNSQGWLGLEPTGESARIIKRLAPLVPATIFCIGKNYAEHAAEFGGQAPERPVMFMKPNSALNHPDAPIRIPACANDDEVDYEAELAVVIGKPGRDIAEADALDHVLGYTCANDVSARWWQKQGGGGQWIRGKSFDTFCPLGPVLLTADEIDDPQNLAISTTLNDKVMQSSNTAKMIFPVAHLIAFLSQDTTLLPGTVILTGTPEGVGFARKPPVMLKPGDTVTVEIETIGKLTNPVR